MPVLPAADISRILNHNWQDGLYNVHVLPLFLKLQEELNNTMKWDLLLKRMNFGDNTTSEGYFGLIPDEILENVLSFLDLKSLGRCFSVAKRWNKFSSVDRLYQRFSNPDFAKISKPKSKSWKWFIRSQRIFTPSQVKSGLGAYKSVNGCVYIGEWKNNVREGYGCAQYEDGSYEGEWKNGEQEGYGLSVTANGKYEGDWLASKMHGLGTYSWTNGQTFVGVWKNGTMSLGTSHISGEYTYEGKFSETEQKSGKGKITYNNGASYVGNWKCETFNGSGVIRWTPEKFFIGKWKDDVQVAPGVYVADGKVYWQENHILDLDQWIGDDVEFDLSKEIAVPMLVSASDEFLLSFDLSSLIPQVSRASMKRKRDEEE